MQPSLSRRMLTMVALIVAAEAVFALPFHITRYFRPTLLDVFGFSHTELGQAQAVYGVVAMLCYFPGGPLADRFNARTLLAMSLAFTAVGGLVMMTIPSLATMAILWGIWGCTSILLLWAALIRATRAWGMVQWSAADQEQSEGVEGGAGSGRAFGILDAGRGLFSIVLANAALFSFQFLLPENPGPEEKKLAMQGLIATYTVATFAASLLAYFAIPKEEESIVVQNNDDKTKISVLEMLVQLLKMSSVWWHALIVVCAYITFKGLDTLGVLARDVYHFDDVQAAQLSTLSAWVRPIAALAAGALADRVSSSKVCFWSFLAVALGFGILAGSAQAGASAMLFVVEIAAASIVVFALRAVYFALLDEAHLPLAFTGAAVGVISVIGYSPDVFVGLISGGLLDAFPGSAGHRYFLFFLAGAGGVGASATFFFARACEKNASLVVK